MGAAKSGGQEVRVGEVFMECAEKVGFPGFGFFRQGNNYALRGRRRLPEEKMQLTGSKDGGWEYTDSAGESKMEISVKNLHFRKSTLAACDILTGAWEPKWKFRVSSKESIIQPRFPLPSRMMG